MTADDPVAMPKRKPKAEPERRATGVPAGANPWSSASRRAGVALQMVGAELATFTQPTLTWLISSQIAYHLSTPDSVQR